ncbi:uncharacterized protein LOC120659098 [Panicum virgatum]|uniref:uncharacterized protein LOC120659098 n=1 Tax=Panicum virgatum TaxID=38727 RepID=UPI0019D6554B|nr:uncharacterized protein LOC120659098 [Panicum virgatum]
MEVRQDPPSAVVEDPKSSIRAASTLDHPRCHNEQKRKGSPPSAMLEDPKGLQPGILLRLPPDELEHLFRAALVCKPWLRTLCDPDFLRRYRAFHGAPPLLGLLHGRQVVEGDPDAHFPSTTSMPDFPHPASDGRRTQPLECRHGRVLVHMLEDRAVDLLVWDPVTGNRHGLRKPYINWMTYSGAVFCTADGCDYLDCHGGPFGVVFVSNNDALDLIWRASVYSSETGAWNPPTSICKGCGCHLREHRCWLIRDGAL